MSKSCCTITRFQHALFDKMSWHLLTVIGLSYHSHKIYEHCGHIDLHAEFTRRVVLWKHVVVIMKTFTLCKETHEEVFYRVDEAIVWFVPEHVCHTVDTKCSMKKASMTQIPTYTECCPQILIPEIPGDHGG